MDTPAASSGGFAMNNNTESTAKVFAVYQEDGFHYTKAFKTAVMTMRVASQEATPDHPISAIRIARFWQGLGYPYITKSKISNILRECPEFKPNTACYNSGSKGGRSTWSKYGVLPSNKEANDRRRRRNQQTEISHVQDAAEKPEPDLGLVISDGGRRLTFTVAGYDTTVSSQSRISLSMTPVQEKEHKKD